MPTATTLFDGRTTYGRNAARTLHMTRLIDQSHNRPTAAFETEQTVVTPRGKLPIKRRWFGGVVNTNRQDWHYVFHVTSEPQRLSNGILLRGDVHEYAYTEAALLPLQLAAVPPIVPTTVKPDLSPAGENHDAWAENLITWVNERLNS